MFHWLLTENINMLPMGMFCCFGSNVEGKITKHIQGKNATIK